MLKKTDVLPEGTVGYFLSNMKSIQEAHIGDTFYDNRINTDEIEAFPGYE